ncbi:MAG: V-type ATPase 116kDa subunit family protein [Hylemonella sp.]|nr:V-type ATPase 116kDa subunit family protein [Hylemonella sp.]
MLRPRPARWFEILAARDDATLVLEALARTGAVELEARAGAGVAADPVELAPLLAEFLDVSARYRAYWPAEPSCRPSAFPQAPAATLHSSLASIRAWAQEAEPMVRALQRADTERRELQLWQRVLGALQPDQIDPGQLAAAGPLLQVQLFVLPAGTEPGLALPQSSAGLELLSSTLEIEAVPHLLVAGRPEALEAVAQRVATLKGSRHAVPRWLQSDANANRSHASDRLLALDAEQAQMTTALDACTQRHALAQALGDVHRLQWLMHNVQALEAGRLFCWITGWTSDAQGDTLAQAVHASAARALLHHPPPPVGVSAPLLLSNPPWSRPFEIFSRALGMPSASEADPTPLLAIVVPLMFGFMFGDVGQGLLLAALGWWYQKRYPIARLLMVGGLSASVFGLLFGSVFGLHGLLPALWLHPLDDPLAVLLAPLLGGAVLLTLGLGLDALAAWWRGALRRWLLTDAALVVVYLGLLGAFFHPVSLTVAAVAALYFCLGHAVLGGRLTAALGALGELVEKTLQILINTLSFARVGAFALAHAGLSSAIVALMDAADPLLLKALVLVLGNVVVIVLEAMVVSIQTTRLVLFEFFTRFMQGQGRAFKPLPPPPFTYQEI